MCNKHKAISNAIKHGSPRSISICLDYHPDSLAVTITDDGSGFNRNEKTSDGIGLSNMEMRAAMLQGKLNIDTHIGQGTTISFHVPNTIKTSN